MALPQRALEQLAREPARTPGWAGRLLMFASTIFFINLFVYLGMVFGYEPYLRSQVQKLSDQIQGFSQQVSTADQAKIATFYSQLANVKTLLRGHTALTTFFAWLERNTMNNVYYTKALVNSVNRQLNVGGVGKTASDVAAQVLLFQGLPEVERVDVRSVGVAPGGAWQFDIMLTLKRDVFAAVAPPAEAAPTEGSEQP